MRRSSEVKFLRCYLPAAVSWANHFTFLSLSYLICEMRVNTKLHLSFLIERLWESNMTTCLKELYSFKQAKPMDVFIITLLTRFITVPFTVEIVLQLLIFKEMWRCPSAISILFLKVSLSKFLLLHAYLSCGVSTPWNSKTSAARWWVKVYFHIAWWKGFPKQNLSLQSQRGKSPRKGSAGISLDRKGEILACS